MGLTMAITSAGALAAGTVAPKNDPVNGTGADEFSWQDEWGTLHMNSMADGLNDPGSLASADGTVGCEVAGAVCDDVGKPKAPAISNGIKFDIKNSVLNCASVVVTNWAKNNPWDPGTTVCTEDMGLDGSYLTNQGGKYLDPVRGKKLIYLPIWDRRSNDPRARNSDGAVGCQQQVINGCVRDIHDCRQSPSKELYDKTPGYKFPVTHVFTPQEVEDLGGPNKQMPNKFYVYQKKLTGTEKRTALSRSGAPTDKVPDTDVEEIAVGADSALSRLKSYRFKNDEDGSQFIVMDPSDFFDLRHYTDREAPEGKYKAGYSQRDSKTGLVLTYDTCPVLGLKTGYSGICDPTGKAGCNLPIYGVGASTTFTDESGKMYTYNDFPIKWSGYVKKWAIISVDQYLENIKGREALYLTDSDINRNPILMLTRADEYCEDLERTSDPSEHFRTHAPPQPDMACIQYMQYQTDDAKSESFFMDLYNPVEASFATWSPEFNTLQLFDVKEDGLPDLNKPVKGTGDDRYLKGTPFGSGKTYVSFFDANNPLSVYNDAKRAKEGKPSTGLRAVWNAEYGKAWDWDKVTGQRKGGPVTNTTGGGAVGEFLGRFQNKDGSYSLDKNRGTGIKLGAGTASVIRFPDPIVIGGKSTSCVVAAYIPTSLPKDAEEVPNGFIPTNSKKEFQAFVNALSGPNPPVQGLKVRRCDATYMSNSDPLAGPNPRKSQKKGPDGTVLAETKHWIGRTSCTELETMPSCNETRLISAQRYCQLENGSLDQCGSCATDHAKDLDQDKSWDWTNASVQGEILVNPTREATQCYFSAACFNRSSDGCPTAHPSGGHVFCFAGEVKITMADGTEKEIKKIKAGEKVKTFNAKQTRNAVLSDGKVKATAVTKKQRILGINDLKITPLHKIVLASGRAVMAKDIKVGDVILKADGSTEAVHTIDTTLKPITVYNLVLQDGNDGYIANGTRVMSYPLVKGMESTMGRPRKYRPIVPASFQSGQ